MNPLESPSAPVSYPGRMRNGVIVLDPQVPLAEGQEVRVEPIPGQKALDEARTRQVEPMRQLFAQWDVEDRETTDDVAEEFHASLEANRGLRLRQPDVDSSVTQGEIRHTRS